MSSRATQATTAPTLRTPVGIGWRHPHYAELLETLPELDFLEVHSENFFAPGGAALAVLREARAHYPVSLHGVGLSLGSASGIDPWHLERLAELVQTIEPVRVSDHASFARGFLAAGSAIHAADLLPIPFTQDALHVLCANVERVQDRLKRSMAVENLSAYIDWAGADMSEPEFLSTLASRTGCGLLVDVNNLYVNARNAQLRDPAVDPMATCCDWLDAMRPAQVAELHLAGHVQVDGIVIDDHGSRTCEAVWSLYQHALQRLGAVPTLIEWDTDVPALSVLLEEGQRARSVARAALDTATDTTDNTPHAAREATA
ncbi:DUF692 domain-containing protein [Hydrogenophaga sp.]|uniref:MNIO family bufferin maturase n=1 Tax=Hydrogenophaga sp. TaxID=1904254 RepID=UPI00356433D7